MDFTKPEWQVTKNGGFPPTNEKQSVAEHSPDAEYQNAEEHGHICECDELDGLQPGEHFRSQLGCEEIV